MSASRAIPSLILESDFWLGFSVIWVCLSPWWSWTRLAALRLAIPFSLKSIPVQTLCLSLFDGLGMPWWSRAVLSSGSASKHALPKGAGASGCSPRRSDALDCSIPVAAEGKGCGFRVKWSCGSGHPTARHWLAAREPCCGKHGTAALLLLFIPDKEEEEQAVDVWERQRAGEKAIKRLSGAQAGAAGREAAGGGGLAPIPAFPPAASRVEEHVWLQKYRC